MRPRTEVAEAPSLRRQRSSNRGRISSKLRLGRYHAAGRGRITRFGASGHLACTPVDRELLPARLRRDFVVERVRDAFLPWRVADVPGTELEQRAGVCHVWRDDDRADLVPVIGTVVAPDEDACETHLALRPDGVGAERSIESGRIVSGPGRVGAGRRELRV